MNTIDELKKQVARANLDLVKYGLVTLTWGNVSAIDRTEGLVVIKPSGVDYSSMTADDMVVVDMEGRIVDGKWKPSSDTATHIELYKSFIQTGGITHTHSKYATIFCQAGQEIPCYGTTHADHFDGTIPLTRFLNEKEVNEAYERYTGKIIVERFKDLNPVATPGVLVWGHAPFCWGKSADDSVKNSLVLERVAEMAYVARQLNPDIKPLPDYILKKHYNRKHGPNAYYGQK